MTDVKKKHDLLFIVDGNDYGYETLISFTNENDDFAQTYKHIFSQVIQYIKYRLIDAGTQIENIIWTQNLAMNTLKIDIQTVKNKEKND